ncbi:conserved hypothetical protein [Edwardsiella phage PEi26]|uniref:Uncharacterized protein n=1 Tax=Edwardsiella phage PEi26 TaxID=1608311 RepID=A0A0B6VLG8_9CAUD|nr:conserved hypothetical protein [Edwardsiella phage PEi26]
MRLISKSQAIGVSIKPWYTARWETVEPEEPVYTEEVPCYDEPTVNELLDLEDKTWNLQSL